METFNEIIHGEQPVLIDFFATWCGPCTSFAPTIEAVAKEYAGRARVLKIDIDKNPELSQQYMIQSVPTLMIFKKGENLFRKSGVMAISELREIIEKFL